jgi:hypothetical protein
LPIAPCGLSVIRPPAAIAHGAAIHVYDCTRPPLAHIVMLAEVSRRLPSGSGRRHKWDDLPSLYRQGEAPAGKEHLTMIRNAPRDAAVLWGRPRQEPVPRCRSRRVVRRVTGQDARKQGHRRARNQDCPDGMGNHHKAGRSMNAEIRPSPERRRSGQKARFGESDDETVDRRIVSSVQKKRAPARTIYLRTMRGCHHGLAATAVHSREAGYI